jgi:outer membrane lipoprotein SlyB
MNNFLKIIVITFLTIILSACSYRPIFNPNIKYKSVGEEVAQSDADICMQEANEYLKASKKRRAAKETARGIGWGSILGGIFGFLIGGDSVGLIKGVAAGAGTGAITGGGGVLAEDTLKPDQIKQRFVSNCLSQKGYQILGWE